MGKKHRPHPAHGEAQPTEGIVEGEAAVAPATDAPAAAESAGLVEGAAGTALVEPMEQGLERLQRELSEMKDRYLRAAADLENVKKRAARERAESWVRAQADVIGRVLEVIDDLARVAQLDPAQTSADALHEGVGLVERKLLRVLEGAGLERIDPSGQPFDPNAHEAVTTAPAPTPEADGTVGLVFQCGYRLSGSLLRPARVAVYTWSEPPAGEVVN